MPPIAVPPWNAHQVLPPIDASNPAAMFRSPYEVTVSDFVVRFATSVERCLILRGFLLLRSELNAAGLVDGFQWVDGSFTENIEVLEGRSPNDVDVVTFIDDTAGNMSNLSADLLNPKWVKINRKVDHYWVELTLDPNILVQLSAYWYSMWSHRRSSQWKGYVKISLDSTFDAAAVAHLDVMEQYFSQLQTQGGNP
ncbi:DUF6932 family protein [Burkholderia contaminans]|uniref:DUF6932 family protein n=1 Tax=Burkholderia contaminans TaxID=488447 RepID=UPI00158BF518|nr:hypothetical protein [Burkholderia contaminans]